MEIHEAANAFPLIGKAELKELAEDIKQNGQKVPISLYNGKILDGRNRFNACKIAGVKPIFTDIYPEDPYMWVWSLNGPRRHMASQEQRALIWKNLHGMSEAMQAERAKVKREANKARAQAAKVQPRDKHGDFISGSCPDRTTTAKPKVAKTREAEAKAAGVSKTAIARADALLKADPELARKVISGEVRYSSAKKLLDKNKAEQNLKESIKKIEETKNEDFLSICKIEVSSCGDFLKRINGVDAVITDPPYPKEFLPVFSELAEACKIAKIPVVAVMSGQSYLPEVYSRMAEHLKYRWTMAYLTPGGQAVQQWEAKVNTSWKPILVFGESNKWFGDVAKSNTNDNDKRFHGWGQSESGMSDLINRLTNPGDLICDPFVGGGSTGVAALSLGRKFIGCDINSDHVENSIKRCKAAVCQK